MRLPTAAMIRLDLKSTRLGLLGMLVFLAATSPLSAEGPSKASRKQMEQTNKMFTEQWMPGTRSLRASPNADAMIKTMTDAFPERRDFLEIYDAPKDAVCVAPQQLVIVDPPAKGFSGQCLVAYIVEADGSVQDTKVLVSSKNEELDEKCRAVVRAYKFKPATVNGRALPFFMATPFQWVGLSEIIKGKAKPIEGVQMSK